MFVLGVTGGIGSGKSAVTARFEKLGIKVVDADVAARTVVQAGQPALAQIAEKFGQGILLDNGELDRAALRKIVFENPQERKWLESLTHPLIREEIIQGLQTATSPYVILVSPLLIESGQFHLTNRILVVDVPEEVQVSRTCARDNNDAAQVQSIIEAQIPRQQRLQHADDVIENTLGFEKLDATVAQLHEQYLSLAAASQ